MELTEKQEKLFFEFCEYYHNYYKDYKYIGRTISVGFKRVYKIEIFLNGYIVIDYRFTINENLNIEKIIKKDCINNTGDERENVTNKWFKFLRKKKLEKLQKYGTN